MARSKYVQCHPNNYLSRCERFTIVHFRLQKVHLNQKKVKIVRTLKLNVCHKIVWNTLKEHLL